MNSAIFAASAVLGKGTLFEVSSVVWRGHLKRLTIRPGPRRLTVPLSACVSTGDQVQLCDAMAWVICHNGRAQILQPYTARETLPLGGLRIEVLVKEITEPGEHEAYSSLAEYHYREHNIHGRTARLIARAFHPLFPQVLGYIELATPFYMNKARATILNAPFQSGSITWEAWDKPTMQRYIHLIVRIARCVVYPEFRGLGLGQILLKHAAEFARQRWQVAGFLPSFLEISADMLKYVPFAEKAGMSFIGETEGNLKRVAKDMEYLIRNAKRVKSGEIVSEEACGIVDQQVARMNRALALMEREGWSRESLVERLQTLSRETILRDFALFHDIISLPKPTYMQGLNPDAELFLACRVAEVAPRNGHVPLLLQVDRLDGPVVLRDVTLTFRSQVRRTQQTHMVQQAFGISPEAVETTVVRRLSLDIQPGSVLLIIGPSGSGKTTLLDLLAAGATHQREAVIMSGDIRWPANCRPGVFQTIRSHRALIEVLGGRDVHATLDLMGLVGLSDAFIYLKRFHELSKGQQYRALLARLITGRYNVWLVDEFCANLDPVTASVVADKLQRTARRIGATVVVAAPHCEQFLWALQPDTVLHMTSAWEYQVVDLTLVTDFPIVTATYGYSRADYMPNQCRLNPFPPAHDYDGRFPIYVDQVHADALLLGLNPERVCIWLQRNGFPPALPVGSDSELTRRAYFVQLFDGAPLRETLHSDRPEARLVFGLLHTLSHLCVRQAALFCGLDRNSLSEYLLPRTLTFALYCNHRFGATIGALTALFEQSLVEWLNAVRDARRCVYDPVCRHHGGNCHACTHLAETSCRFFNLNLGRSFLFGGADPELAQIPVGYFDSSIL